VRARRGGRGAGVFTCGGLLGGGGYGAAAAGELAMCSACCREKDGPGLGRKV